MGVTKEHHHPSTVQTQQQQERFEQKQPHAARKHLTVYRFPGTLTRGTAFYLRILNASGALN